MNLVEAAFTFALQLATQEPRYSTIVDVPTVRAISQAAVDVSTSLWEVETLVRIARSESGFDPDVVLCKRINGFGAKGAFQVVPRSTEELIAACSTDIRMQANLALFRIRESVTVCGRMGIHGADSLGIYTHGRCFWGNWFSRMRYGNGNELLDLIGPTHRPDRDCTRR